MSDQNPYQSPIEEPVVIQVPAKNKLWDFVKKLAESGKPIFLRWEKLRVLFIGLCSAFSIFAMYKQEFWPDTLEHWIVLIGGAFVANVLYLAGPIVESYLKWLEYPYQMVGNFLFLAGTAVTCMLAWWTIEGLKELPSALAN